MEVMRARQQSQRLAVTEILMTDATDRLMRAPFQGLHQLSALEYTGPQRATTLQSFTKIPHAQMRTRCAAPPGFERQLVHQRPQLLRLEGWPSVLLLLLLSDVDPTPANCAEEGVHGVGQHEESWQQSV